MENLLNFALASKSRIRQIIDNFLEKNMNKQFATEILPLLLTLKLLNCKGEKIIFGNIHVFSIQSSHNCFSFDPIFFFG